MKGLYRMLFLTLITATLFPLSACTDGASESTAVSPTRPVDDQPPVLIEAADAETTESVAEPTAIPTPAAMLTPTVASTITGEAVAYIQNDTLFIKTSDSDEVVAVDTCSDSSFCLLQYLKWSPDGKHLLYYYYADENDSLRLSDLQGNLQIISDDIASFRPGAWAPGGKAIAFFRFTGAYTEGSETERPADIHEVWTAVVGADGTVGELQVVGHINLYSGCGGGGRSASQVLYEKEGGTSYGFLMGVSEWTTSGILLYTTHCTNVGIGRFDINSGMELESFNIPLRSLVLNSTRDRWYAVADPDWATKSDDNQLATGTPDSLVVEIIPTSQPVELVFYGPVSGRLYYSTRELVERVELGYPGYEYFPFYRSALWTINTDGTGEALLWHAEDHAFASVTERPDGNVLFTRVENERELYKATQDATINDLLPYQPQRHIMEVPVTGGEPLGFIENAGQPELTMAP